MRKFKDDLSIHRKDYFSRLFPFFRLMRDLPAFEPVIIPYRGSYPRLQAMDEAPDRGCTTGTRSVVQEGVARTYAGAACEP